MPVIYRVTAYTPRIDPPPFPPSRCRPHLLLVYGAHKLMQMRQLHGKHGLSVTERDLVSHAQYPAVFKVGYEVYLWGPAKTIVGCVCLAWLACLAWACSTCLPLAVTTHNTHFWCCYVTLSSSSTRPPYSVCSSSIFSFAVTNLRGSCFVFASYFIY